MANIKPTLSIPMYSSGPLELKNRKISSDSKNSLLKLVKSPGIKDAILNALESKIKDLGAFSSEDDKRWIRPLENLVKKISGRKLASAGNAVKTTENNSLEMYENPLFTANSAPLIGGWTDPTLVDQPLTNPREKLKQNDIFRALIKGEPQFQFFEVKDGALVVKKEHLSGCQDAVKCMSTIFEEKGLKGTYEKLLEETPLKELDILNAWTLKLAKHDKLTDAQFLNYLADGTAAFLEPASVPADKKGPQLVVALGWAEKALGSVFSYDRGATKIVMTAKKTGEFIELFKECGGKTRWFASHFKDGKVGEYLEFVIPFGKGNSFRELMPSGFGSALISADLNVLDREFVMRLKDMGSVKQINLDDAKKMFKDVYKKDMPEDFLTKINEALKENNLVKMAGILDFEMGIGFKQEHHGGSFSRLDHMAIHATKGIFGKIFGVKEKEQTSGMGREINDGNALEAKRLQKEHPSGIGKTAYGEVLKLGGLLPTDKTGMIKKTKSRFSFGKADASGETKKTKLKEEAIKYIDSRGKTVDVSIPFIMQKAISYLKEQFEGDYLFGVDVSKLSEDMKGGKQIIPEDIAAIKGKLTNLENGSDSKVVRLFLQILDTYAAIKTARPGLNPCESRFGGGEKVMDLTDPRNMSANGFKTPGLPKPGLPKLDVFTNGVDASVV